jgi:hypothetical protein
MAREEEGFFDDLARGLADGSLTRGKALRLMGAALVGGTLGSLGIGEASADRPGCKREGKHCARTEQCCGTLVCVSGSCQTPTTTTTETPTTTTTTMCLPNGGTCTTGGTPCCSGTCNSNGFCCEAGRVGLSNGTCARPCGLGGECDVGCGSVPNCEAETPSGGAFCSVGGVVGGLCATTSNCPSGQFCTSGSCVVAC